MSMSADKLKLFDFVPWDEAQPGDLLYAFTTFYSTSLAKEGNAGRLKNIALASERLTGCGRRGSPCEPRVEISNVF